MKYIVLLISMIVAGCNTSPVIIPDTSGDSVVMLQLKDQITQPGGVKPSYGWVLWYVPIVIIASLWSYREFVRRPLLCEEDGKLKDEIKTPTPPPSV